MEEVDERGGAERDRGRERWRDGEEELGGGPTVKEQMESNEREREREGREKEER